MLRIPVTAGVNTEYVGTSHSYQRVINSPPFRFRLVIGTFYAPEHIAIIIVYHHYVNIAPSLYHPLRSLGNGN